MKLNARYCLAVCCILSFVIHIIGCKTTETTVLPADANANIKKNLSTELIEIGGQKEVKLNVNIDDDNQRFQSNDEKSINQTSNNIQSSKKSDVEIDNNILQVKLVKNEIIQTADREDYLKFKLFINNVNAGIIKNIDNNLWLYLEATRKFYDNGWYRFDYLTQSLEKAIKNYFDIDLLNNLTPKYNKNEYYYFKKIEFDKIGIYRFNKLLYKWLATSFYQEIKDNEIMCIAFDEKNNELWFGLKNSIKKFNINNEIWQEPYKERKGGDVLKNNEINQIFIFDDYIWFSTFNCEIISFDKKRDIWNAWLPDAFRCSYFAFVGDYLDNVWFKSDVGLWRYNKQNNQWYEFDPTNYLSNKIIKKSFIDANSNLWIETPEEIAIYNLDTKHWEIHKKINFSAKNRQNQNYLDSIYSIAFYDNKVWISTETGLLNYDVKTQCWLIFDKKDMNDIFRTDFTYFGNLFIADNQLWLGTNDGLFRLKLK